VWYLERAVVAVVITVQTTVLQDMLDGAAMDTPFQVRMGCQAAPITAVAAVVVHIVQNRKVVDQVVRAWLS
jgi:hypothetical protein